MRRFHAYNHSDNLAVSWRNCRIFHKNASPQAFLRHTLKDGIPLCYWFTIETETHWFDVDIRKLFDIDDHPIISSLSIIKKELRNYLIVNGVKPETLTGFLLELEGRQQDICFSEARDE